MAQVRSTSSTRVAPETRLIRAGARDCDLVKTVAPPIQKGSTVLLRVDGEDEAAAADAVADLFARRFDEGD